MDFTTSVTLKNIMHSPRKNIYIYKTQETALLIPLTAKYNQHTNRSICEQCDPKMCHFLFLNNSVKWTELRTWGSIYKISYDNLTIDLRQPSNLQNILQRMQGFFGMIHL